MRLQLFESRILVVGALFSLYFVVAAYWVVDIGYLSADTRLEAVHRQRQAQVSLPGERGRIVDRNGTPLALSVEAFAVDLHLGAFREPSPHGIASLAAALDRAPEWVAERIEVGRRRGSRSVSLRANATPEQVRRVAALGFSGIVTTPTRTRMYPQGTLAGQLIGFTSADGHGQAGVEQAYDEALHAERTTLPVGVSGWLQRGPVYPPDLDAVRPEQGANLRLTIDAQLQRVVEDELVATLERRGAESGVAVVMDVATGAVLAMASAPLFDPSDPQQRIGSLQRNRATFDRFEPGSTFKPLLAAAALEAGVVSPEREIHCENGSFRVGRFRITDHKRYGWLSFHDVIRFSSNIGVAKVARDLGAERFESTLRAFNIGAMSGIDLEGERPGFLPRRGKWGESTLATVSYGYGVSVTPLQLAQAYAALANGGKVLQPYVVAEARDASGEFVHRREPTVLGQAISPETAALVTEMLVAAVEEGTGTAARVPGVVVAGKTGTARKIDPETRKYSKRDYLASFAGYFPAYEPRYAVVVMIDRPRREYYGGAVAAPVFREIATFLSRQAGWHEPTAPVPAITEFPEGLRLARWTEPAVRAMPSFLGMSLREAMVQAARSGWDVETEGAGFVVWQDPPPGLPASDGRTLRLHLDVVPLEVVSG